MYKKKKEKNMQILSVFLTDLDEGITLQLIKNCKIAIVQIKIIKTKVRLFLKYWGKR